MEQEAFSLVKSQLPGRGSPPLCWTKCLWHAVPLKAFPVSPLQNWPCPKIQGGNYNEPPPMVLDLGIELAVFSIILYLGGTRERVFLRVLLHF